MLRFAPMERVFVTGGTGFVGRAVLRSLVAQGFLVRCLVRRGSEADLRGFEAIDRVPGDVLQADGLVAAAEGCTAIVNLVGIIREHPSRGITFRRLHVTATENMLQVARAAGIERFVQMSALGARTDARAEYHRTKWQAEEAIRASGLDWTIFRPSIIFGPGDGLVSMLARMIRLAPAVPVIGNGRYQLQPIAVEQVAEAFARALRVPATVGRAYEAAGSTAYPYVEILDQIGAAIGRPRVRKVHAPLTLVRGMTRLLQWLPAYPLTMDQITMLVEGSTADPSAFYRDLDIRPESFSSGLARMFGQRRARGTP
ncbi:MAG TPA: complex I NDUFA9 subunit family protein [Candidatus Binatia bacterium]|nr:complex I NDUFA9 subunit family protein [Candidatus Binatia bacterium]